MLLCRFIIMQHRKAADVQDPHRLMSSLERIIGTAPVQQQIEEASEKISLLEEEINLITSDRRRHVHSAFFICLLSTSTLMDM